jgi:O-succinylbenzoic acid--CoA ligase
MTSLATWLTTAARQTPKTVALLSAKGRWTYNDLALQARNGGAFLHERLQAPSGAGSMAGNSTIATIATISSIIAIAGSASDLAHAAVACSAAGVAFLPLDPLTMPARWPHLCALAGDRLQAFSPLPLHLPEAASDWCKNTDAAQIALIIATSGSEGAPKAVQLTVANLDYAAAVSNEWLSLAPGDLWLGCLPLHHIGGMSTLYRCIRAAATLLLHDGFDAARVWHDLQAHPVTHISLVPAMLARLLDQADGAAPPATLRHALIGGAALSRPLFERASASGWPINPTWGMSECAAQVATLRHPDEHWQEGEVGTPLPGFEVRIDAEGRICLRGPQVMAGYLNPESPPGANVNVGVALGSGLDDGWLTTADLGRIDSAGRLTVLGRADEVFNSGGIKVHPLEIESRLAACPGVSDVAVTALPDLVWGDVLVALLVGTADTGFVAHWSRQHLASAHRPRYWLKLEQLPRNAMGKIERNALHTLARSAKAAA